MANELQLQTSPTQADLTVYAIIRNPAGLVWQTTTATFVTYADANLANYDVALAEDGTSSGYYVGSFPTGIVTAATYTVTIWKQAGGAPATTDTLLGIIDALSWNGTSLSEDSPSGDDLISLAYYKEVYGITSTDATRDTALAHLITSESKAIVNFCGKGFKLTAYTEFYDMDEASDTLYLRNHPINALTTVTLYPYDTNVEAIAGSNYIVKSATGEIRIKPTATATGIFPRGFATVKAEYTGGAATVPADVKGVCAAAVKAKYDALTSDQTLESETLGDYSYKNAAGGIVGGLPKDVAARLRKYCNYSV